MERVVSSQSWIEYLNLVKTPQIYKAYTWDSHVSVCLCGPIYTMLICLYMPVSESFNNILDGILSS